MHDLRDKPLNAGVPKPNRAERRKAEAEQKLWGNLDMDAERAKMVRLLEENNSEKAVQTLLGPDYPRPNPMPTEDEAAKFAERTSKGVRIVRRSRL